MATSPLDWSVAASPTEISAVVPEHGLPTDTVQVPELLARILITGAPLALAPGATRPRKPRAGSTAVMPAAARRSRLWFGPASRWSPGPLRDHRLMVDNMVKNLLPVAVRRFLSLLGYPTTWLVPTDAQSADRTWRP